MPWSWLKLTRAWLKWFLLCPLRWSVLRDIKGVKARWGPNPPTRAIFRIYHPAYWVLFWSLMWAGRACFQGKNLRWLVWCGGGFIELLLTRRLPTDKRA